MLLLFSRPVCLWPGVLPLIRLSGAWSLRNCYGLSFKTCTAIQARPRQVAFLRLPPKKYILHSYILYLVYILQLRSSYRSLRAILRRSLRHLRHSSSLLRPVHENGPPGIADMSAPRLTPAIFCRAQSCTRAQPLVMMRAHIHVATTTTKYPVLILISLLLDYCQQ